MSVEMMQILPSSCGTKPTHSIENILGLAGSNDTSEGQTSEHSKRKLDLADKEKHNNHHRSKDISDDYFLTKPQHYKEDTSDEVEFDSNIQAEYDNSNAGKEKKKKHQRNRTIFSTFQLCELERFFMKSHYLDAFMREELAARLSLPKLTVQVRQVSFLLLYCYTTINNFLLFYNKVIYKLARTCYYSPIILLILPHVNLFIYVTYLLLRKD
ncbi:retinal homeobox protein Rx-B-like [Anneissia japonica]|uniref:retinal homeobox protein Rx-B-like n=1 Tax=Anneissia japonica TaxID=1529436 RepID=UPI001425B28F|nr:retinal homeobox protein Rx-B-like [Anneissia japonica]